jgi:hypothetical protein
MIDPKRVALVTFTADTSNVPAFDAMHALALPHREAYCERYGYQHWHWHGSDYSHGYYAIQRIKYVLDKLAKDEADAAWILNLDSVITNPTYRIHDFSRGDGICITRDLNGLNAGSMIVHRSEKTLRFLEYIMTEAWLTSHPWREQHIIQSAEFEERWQDRYTVLPHPSIGQYRKEAFSGPGQEWKKGDFVIRFPGKILTDRVELIRWALTQVTD